LIKFFFISPESEVMNGSMLPREDIMEASKEGIKFNFGINFNTDKSIASGLTVKRPRIPICITPRGGRTPANIQKSVISGGL